MESLPLLSLSAFISFPIPFNLYTQTHLFTDHSKSRLHKHPATRINSKRKKGIKARETRERESKAGYSWREEVEERLIKKSKKKPTSGSEKLNLDTLDDLGPQWYVVRVSRVRGDQTAELIARLLAKNYPDLDFKVYAPSVKIKTKLKSGTYSVKPKPIFPGCVFLWCVLNKEIHDFIRECEGVGGFVGSKVGNMKRQINRPRPVSSEDMEDIFRQTKEEQENFNETFLEEHQEEGVVNLEKLVGNDTTKSVTVSKPTRGSRKTSVSLANDSPGKKIANSRRQVQLFGSHLGILQNS